MRFTRKQWKRSLHSTETSTLGLRTGWRKGRCRCRSTNTSDHRDLFPRAVERAGLDPDQITRYALRHSLIVRALLWNVPVDVVAQQHDTLEATLRNAACVSPVIKSLMTPEAPPIVARDVPVRNLLVG
jgi:hypothetical protein